MKIKTIIDKVKNKTLTYSDVVQLMFEQPVADGTSHAHMHTREGLTSTDVSKSGFGPEEAHTFMNAHGLTTYDPSAMVGTVVTQGIVYIDQERVVKSGVYSARGAPSAPEIRDPNRMKFRVTIPVSGGKPEIIDVLKGEFPLIDFDNIQGSDITAIAAKKKPSLVADLSKKFGAKAVKDSDLVRPARKASAAHSMFPDVESMIMHLTAALYSEAGKRALIFLRVKPLGETVGIFSNTAATYVESVEASGSSPLPLLKRRRMIDRARNTDVNGDLAAGYTWTEGKIDHVELILARSSTDDMVVVTCYPTAKTTKDSIGTTTTATQDICEPNLGNHILIPTTSYPAISW